MNSNISALREKIVEAARRYLGIEEATGANDGKPSDLFVFGERKNWCAGFVARCFVDAGSPLPGKPWLLPSVEYMEKSLSEADRLLHRREAHQAAPGDIIFFRWKDGSRHCGIVERVEGAVVHTIEGNVGNAVRRKSYPVTSPNITGYGVAEADADSQA